MKQFVPMSAIDQNESFSYNLINLDRKNYGNIQSHENCTGEKRVWVYGNLRRGKLGNL